jgi:DNA topoisomerase-3
MLNQLRRRDGVSVGRLFDDIDTGGLDRRDLEALLASAARSGLVTVEEERFTREGRTINYRAVRLTDESAEELEDEDVLRRLRVREMAASHAPRGKAGRTRKPRPSRSERTTEPAEKRTRARSEVRMSGPSGLVDALKQWRLGEARRYGIPAFLVLTDRQLAAVASEAPTSESTLRELTGLGDKKVRKYGDAILRVVREAGR